MQARSRTDFTGGLVSGQVAQAEAGQQAALANYQAAIQSAFADVENSLVTRQTLVRQVDAEVRRVRALSEYARLAKLQYDGGFTDYLTVLNASQPRQHNANLSIHALPTLPRPS